jgi:D-3-phosphoglycerate dehydrogenase
MLEKKYKVLVTPRSISREGHAELERLKDAGYDVLMPWPGEQPNEEQLLQKLPLCVGYLAGVERISAEVLRSAPDLKVISRNGVGLDNIDLKTAEELGITVTSTPGANSQGVAELALSLILDGLRSVSWSSTRMDGGKWERKKGRELAGLTLGVIGCGNIGKRLAKMAIGLGMNVVGYDVYHDQDLEQIQHFRYVTLSSIFSLSDILSLHCPPEKTPLINEENISLCRDGVILVNTARDGLIDHVAVLNALNTGKVSCYATDVYQTEPPELDDLLRHDRVIKTPHIGGFTKESIERATTMAVDNILEVLCDKQE